MKGTINFDPYKLVGKKLLISFNEQGMTFKGLQSFNLAELSVISCYLQYLLFKDQLVKDGIEGKIDVQVK